MKKKEIKLPEELEIKKEFDELMEKLDKTWSWGDQNNIGAVVGFVKSKHIVYQVTITITADTEEWVECPEGYESDEQE
jgi:hypothetical protein